MNDNGNHSLFTIQNYKKKYKNFILELDYKTSEPKANSGIFLRVPDIPVSDDYIYHSFEIQINEKRDGNYLDLDRRSGR